jgi:transposase InsO family protein
MDDVIRRHQAIFGKDLGEIKGVEVKIHLRENASPIFSRARPVPFALRDRIGAALDRAERDGTLERVTHSDWASPTVNIEKPNGDFRVCSDFKRTVNPQIFVDEYPLPTVSDMFAQLDGSCKFTKLDMAKCFEQLVVEEKSRELLTINTHQGLYRHRRLAYGIASAPAACQRSIESLLKNVELKKGQKLLLFIDDVLLGSPSEDSLIDLTDRVLSVLESAGARLNFEKCQFNRDSVEYLGHKISQQGIGCSEKAKSVLEAPLPKTKTELKSFFGLVTYYSKFCADLATISTPLRNLLKDNVQFVWDEECTSAFNRVKELLSSPPILAFYNPSKPLLLQCDASATGLGCVLSTIIDGQERPIEYAHRALSPTEQRYSQIDRESLSLVWGVTKFHKYLYGRSFTLITDHRPLVRILGEKEGIPAVAANRLHRYALLLCQYQYSIQYKSGKTHLNCDALSRLPVTVERPPVIDHASKLYVNQISTVPINSGNTSTLLASESLADPILSRVRSFLLNGWPDSCKDTEILPYFHKRNELTVEGNCVLWARRVVIPDSLRSRVLDELHQSHPGIERMRQLARIHVWWPRINSDIELRVANCEPCQTHRSNPPKADVISWPEPARPWSRIHLDFAPQFHGRSLLILVDTFSSWVEVAIMTSMTSEKTIECLSTWFSRFGFPDVIVSDNGTQFTSSAFASFVEEIGARHCFSAPGHPATNGSAERTVQSVKKGLKKILSDSNSRSLQAALTNWLFRQRFLPCSKGCSPAELFLGRKIRNPVSLFCPPSSVDSHPKPENSSLVGETVRFRRNLLDKTWASGKVHQVLGSRHFLISDQNDAIFRRHSNQIIFRKS